VNLESAAVFLGFCLACGLAASMGALFRPGAWYEKLEKPRWRPPNWLFAPVWSLLYLAVALAGWLVWRQTGIAGGALPLSLYAIQLLLNAAWTPIFFGLHRIGAALIEIIALVVAIVLTMFAFWQVDVRAALLLLPYLAWVIFASALTFSIWRLNHRV
jgi:benzodiazapine receptor